MILDDALARWEDHLRLNQGKSENTIRVYIHSVRKIANGAAVEQLTLDQVRGRLADLQHLAPSSRAQMISAIKTFNKWCVRAGLTADQSVQRLTPPKIPDTLAEPHSERDALALCNVIRDEAMPTREQVLPWAIVELLYGCGLRISELTGLDLADIDTQSMSLKVRGGKGDKDRVLPIGPQQLLPILM